MINDKKTFQARASLVDRLMDDLPGRSREVHPLRTLNRQKFRESLFRDLLWLLNTRTPLPGAQFDETDLTVIDYGTPDFGAYATASSDDQVLMLRRMARAISAFEPRLREVRVITDPVTMNEKAVRVSIDAVLVVDDVREPVSFRTVYHTNSAEWHTGSEEWQDDDADPVPFP